MNLMITLSTLSILTSLTFCLLKHPLSMGFALLCQTFIMCMVNGLNLSSYWYSYALFITFLGGMLVLFIYMASVASNEKFMFSLNLKLSCSMILFFILFYTMDLFMYINKSLNNESASYLMMEKFGNPEFISISKMFMLPDGSITILVIIYLFITMVSIVKITNLTEGPLRKKN